MTKRFYPIPWCNAHGYRWAVINTHFFWQTNYQTGEITPDNKIIWHEYDYYNKIIKEHEI